MPGILSVDSCSVGLQREAGKMSLPNQDMSSLDMLDFTEEEAANLEEFAQYLQSDRANSVLESVLSSDSAPSSSSSSPSRDNDSDDELSDSENALDLEKFLDTHISSGIMLSDHYDTDGSQRSKGCQLKRPSNNPFMGLQDSSATDHLLNHGYSALEEQQQCYPYQAQSTANDCFVAWGHTPPEDEEHILMLISSSMNEDTDETLPDTPSSYSGTVTGDDSDVDIETITDIPRTADACGYTTHDSSPALSPANSPSPIQNHATSNTISPLHRSFSSPIFNSSQSLNSSQPLIRYNSCGVSNSASLAENLISGRPTAAQKRKLQKEKKASCKNTTTCHQPVTPTFPHTGTSTNSLNFHDYAMSPISCTSLDTAQPTVISSKRLCKRRQLNTLDLSEKEKQHHHNQLERNRRQKLADLFVDLRDVVPNIAHQTKASKVMILNKATSYIEDLQIQDSQQLTQLTRELERNQFLRRQKRQLESFVK